MKSQLSRVMHQGLRNYVTKSLVLKTRPKKKSQSRLELEEAFREKLSQKKTKTVTKKESDYFENVWLDDLDLKTLKLYRKTSFGSFRKININDLLEKIKELQQKNGIKNLDKTKELKEQALLGVSSTDSKKEEDILASPQMSDLLVKNMLSFPLLRENCTNNIIPLYKEESEDYGVIDSLTFPSVSRVLNETMSEASRDRLNEWNKQMVAKLGVEGFEKYRKDLLRQGTTLHRRLKTFFETGKEVDDEDDAEIKGCWQSLNKLLANISQVKMVEESVHHPLLMYKGVIDCVATYQDVPCIIEWKKSKKIKSQLSATYDAPLQLCAYLGALSWQKSFVRSTRGLVVIAYTCGTPANVFEMDEDCCQYYWTLWLRRLQTYWLKRSTVLLREEAET